MAPTREQNDTAAKKQLEHHNAQTEAAGARLARLAAAAKPQGRQKTGLNGDDLKRLVRLVSSRQNTWEDCKAAMPDIADQVLEAWKEEAFQRAGK